MNNHVSVSDTSSPVVCTLQDRDRDERELEWSDLGALALSIERITGGIQSTYPLQMLSSIEDLANRESACCGTWLSIAVARSGGVVRLELTTPNLDGLAMITAMAGLES